MNWMLDAITWVLLLGGAFFSIVGGIGIVRLPDFFARLHGGGITDTLGAGLILLGLMFQAGWSLALVKLIMILAFLFVTSPTACHALAHAALSNGLQPQLVEPETQTCDEGQQP
ncbi:MAG: monovalent cation/H(+) antiporter subunit G [Planctomycetales bacterium]|nr:monovalent cation/H(+) antiporter subunit G [Planctomycetales bacterium]